jgi:glycosyltransferase involved in cell wall biosynthesis
VIEAITSAVENAGYPLEVICHDDGSDHETQSRLLELLHWGKISKLILSPPGHNEGVGTAFNRCAAISTGDPIIKFDQDLLCESNWLRTVVGILDADLDLAGVGLFKYHVDPVRWQDKQLEVGAAPDAPASVPYHYVEDFVSSAIAIPREVWEGHGPWPEHSHGFGEDVTWKLSVRAQGLQLALPDSDLAYNRGFGYGPSTVCLAPGQIQEIHDGPLVLGT